MAPQALCCSGPALRCRRAHVKGRACGSPHTWGLPETSLLTRGCLCLRTVRRLQEINFPEAPLTTGWDKQSLRPEERGGEWGEGSAHPQGQRGFLTGRQDPACETPTASSSPGPRLSPDADTQRSVPTQSPCPSSDSALSAGLWPLPSAHLLRHQGGVILSPPRGVHTRARRGAVVLGLKPRQYQRMEGSDSLVFLRKVDSQSDSMVEAVGFPVTAWAEYVLDT